MRDGPETTVAYASRVYSVSCVGASTCQTEYTRDAYATVLGDVRAPLGKASPTKPEGRVYTIDSAEKPFWWCESPAR
jgi:hypothetical protein